MEGEKERKDKQREIEKGRGKKGEGLQIKICKLELICNLPGKLDNNNMVNISSINLKSCY